MSIGHAFCIRTPFNKKRTALDVHHNWDQYIFKFNVVSGYSYCFYSLWFHAEINGCWLLIKFPRLLPMFEYFEIHLVQATAIELLVPEIYGCYIFIIIGLKVFHDIYKFNFKYVDISFSVSTVLLK